MDPQLYGQLLFEKVRMNIQCKKESLQQILLGKLDSHMQKNEIGSFPYTTHENRLKMDEGSQCEKGIHQNPRGEHRQQPLRPQPQQHLPRNITKGKGSKGKNELLGFYQDQKLLHSKGNSEQNQKTTDRMGEDICK